MSIQAVVSFFVGGGFWMYPILLVGALGVAISIERFITLSRVENANRKMWDQLQPLLNQGNIDKAREMTVHDTSTVSQLLQASLELQGAARRREDYEVVMEEEMMAIVPQLEKRIAYTALYANMATLLGLLGTVSAYRTLAPHAVQNHPTDEHLLPLFVALGAADKIAGAQRLNNVMTYGILAMDAWLFDPL